MIDRRFDAMMAQGALDEGQMHFNAMFAREGRWVFCHKGQRQQLFDGSAIHWQQAKRRGAVNFPMYRANGIRYFARQ